MKLETKRLILRPLRESDWEDLVEGVGEIDVAKMTETMPHPYKKKDALWWINETNKHWRKKKKEKYYFSIELKSEKKVIGSIDLFKVNKFNGTAETGSWINKKYWKKGYITEAKIAVNDFAFNKLKLRKLNSGAYKSNKASNATQKKVGYKLEGMQRKEIRCKATGKIHDANLYGLLKKDWKKVRPKLIKDLNRKIKNKKG